MPGSTPGFVFGSVHMTIPKPGVCSDHPMPARGSTRGSEEAVLWAQFSGSPLDDALCAVRTSFLPNNEYKSEEKI